jgi:glycosyltransferase involved in cell wall biosynthesis
MEICFIEDTHLFGGTQIWVTEAVRYFLTQGDRVSVLAPKSSRVVRECSKTAARLVTYDWDRTVEQDTQMVNTWVDALSPADVAVCTVHPPRNDFHASIFAARCIKDGGLNTHLVTKSGTVVPEYKREFYIPDQSTTVVDRNIARIAYKLPDAVSPVLGCIGSFEKRKGQIVLLEALSSLAAGPLPDIHLMLVGEGPDEAQLKRKVQRLGLDGCVSFHPFTPAPELIYPNLDITVLPSLSKEGLPNVLLESLAMQVPVVASQLGGVSEAVIDGQTGYAVVPGDPEELVHAIVRLWTDQRTYQRMRVQGRELVVEKYNKEKQFERFRNLFRALS